MNDLLYKFIKLLRKNKNTERINTKFIDNLYDFYLYASFNDNSDISINEDDFRRFFFIVYDVFSLVISNDEFEIKTQKFINSIMNDAKIYSSVDINWCIDHLWYYEFDMVFSDASLIKFTQNKLRLELLNKKLDIKTLNKLHTRVS